MDQSFDPARIYRIVEVTADELEALKRSEDELAADVSILEHVDSDLGTHHDHVHGVHADHDHGAHHHHDHTDITVEEP